MHCKFILLQYTSNINHIRASTCNIRQTFSPVTKPCIFCLPIENLNPQMNMILVIDLRCAYMYSFSDLCKINKCRNGSQLPDKASL